MQQSRMETEITETILIKPGVSPFRIDWGEIWKTKDLLYFLTWRDIKVRYKQTILGILWIILQPLVSMVLFTIVFGNFAKIPSDSIPYPIFVFIGLLFWNFFSQTLSSTSNSLIANASIIKKVYFPRILSPVSSVLSHIVDIVPALIILLGLLAYYKVVPSLLMILLLPYLLILILFTSLGIGMFLAPINARFRDVRHILPYFIQLGLFATPVIYPSSLFGGKSTIMRIFNPVAEAIEVSRSGFFNTRPMDWTTLILSSLFGLLIFVCGFYYFRTKEDSFIDTL